ncbi:MAG: carbon storage regulator [Pirellulales bacterium]|nr:carbon storage regulator [Pirellulales bacterium]
MLVLSRKVNEAIHIGQGITVTVTRISGNRVTLGITAPANMKIIRSELKPFPETPCNAPVVTTELPATLVGSMPPR